MACTCWQRFERARKRETKERRERGKTKRGTWKWRFISDRKRTRIGKEGWEKEEVQEEDEMLKDDITLPCCGKIFTIKCELCRLMEGQVFIIFCILYSPHLCLSLCLSLCFLSILNSIQLCSAGTKADQHCPVSVHCVCLSLFLSFLLPGLFHCLFFFLSLTPLSHLSLSMSFGVST